MRVKINNTLILSAMFAALSCSQNRCSPTSPEETVAPHEIVYHHSDHKTPALDNKLHVTNIETGAYRVLGEIENGSPIVWRKDLNEVFYVYSLAANRFELRASASEGTAKPRVVVTLSFFARHLSFAANGQHLAVTGAAQGFHLVPVRDGVPARVGNNAVKYVEFSPKDDQLAQILADSQAVYIINRVGDVKYRFALAFKPDGLRWSPNGSKLACWNGSRTNAALVTLSDPFPRPLEDLGELAWSPDGKEIVYSDLNTNLGKMDAEGNNKTLLGTTGLGAQWSPNGKHLAFIEQNGNDCWLFTADAQGMNRKPLAPLHGRSFAWRPF